MKSADETVEPQGLLPRFTLRDADTFLLADALGDIQGGRHDGLFTSDTRFLSRFELQVGERRPSLLGAALSQDSTLFTAHLTNLPLPALGEGSVPKGVIHVERSRTLSRSRVFERLRLKNFSERAAQVPIGFTLSADFADIFEVQGATRKERGVLLPTRRTANQLALGYRGLDDRERWTYISFSPKPAEWSPEGAKFVFALQPAAAVELFVEIGSEEQAAPSAERFKQACEASEKRMQERAGIAAHISTSFRLFSQWTQKSRFDLALLTTDLATGPYPYAGVPWFATQFGRDAIITALQNLWAEPRLAEGVLRFLASTQAHDTSAYRDSEPGKILHEMRRGEMAALKEVPFAQYYGAVDTTPLFVMLAGAYERQTGDRRIVDEIWSNLKKATAWIERKLAEHDSGFLYYARGERSGLVNQGWKDSQDSIFHEDGSFPTGAVAVVEVQGYAYSALAAMATLARARGEDKQAAHWSERAETLRAAIEQTYWMPEHGFYAIALDAGTDSVCRVAASNAGHLLYCGVPEPERGRSVCAQLLSPRFSTGWGIRTLADDQPRFNPMSYHNGSVWPHDTAIAAAGIARYGGGAEVAALIRDLFEAANHFGMRLPELYCGFRRADAEGPTPYPVACLPQAWAAGSVFMLLQACLGIDIDGGRRTVNITRPQLPVGIESFCIAGLPVAQSRIDLEFQRMGHEVAVVPSGHLDSSIRVLVYL
ncbi:MAG TPA: amylo-alpha-1,6-glucosidase [Steroidobacteraceae bacterium]|nr:amylo-alpha-1,6-glucosidase [Steroidobacteraceae bacterium]